MTSKKLFGFLATNGTMSLLPMSLISATLMLAQPQTSIKTRETEQQQRIGQGVEQGSLTAGEAARLERGEARINQQVQADRAANGGKLTPTERTQVNQELNGMSNRIYNDKRNAESARYGNNEVDARRHDQQQRIAEGMESGKLNASQAAKLESKESAINREVRQDRQGNGGRLTRSEQARVSRQLNRTSGQIYRAKQR